MADTPEILGTTVTIDTSQARSAIESRIAEINASQQVNEDYGSGYGESYQGAEVGDVSAVFDPQLGAHFDMQQELEAHAAGGTLPGTWNPAYELPGPDDEEYEELPGTWNLPMPGMKSPISGFMGRVKAWIMAE